MIILAISENPNVLTNIKNFLGQIVTERNNVIQLGSNLEQIQVFDRVGNAEHVSAMIEQYHPDIVFLENDFKHHRNTGVLVDIIEHYPEVGFFIISNGLNSEETIEVMRAGAIEILPFDMTQDTVENAIARFINKKKRVLRSKSKGKILAFIPCKGGSGSTFIATNLAYALAVNENKRVLIIDFNLQLGDAVLFLSNDKPDNTIADVSRQIHRLDSIFLASSVMQILPNLHILPSPEEPEKSTDVYAEHVSPILQIARQNYDFVILDIGRRLDAITVKALDESDFVYPILQQTLPFLRDARRLLEMFYSLGYSKNKIQMIVNRYSKKSEINLDDVSHAMKIAVNTTIPNDYESVEKSVNHGESVLKLMPKSSVSLALSELAASLCEEQHQKSNWIKRLFDKEAS